MTEGSVLSSWNRPSNSAAPESTRSRSVSSEGSGKPPGCQRANLSCAIEVLVDVEHPALVMERGLSDETVRDRRAMPHTVMMGEVPLQA